MIALKRLNGQEFVLNADLIETVESTPDTIIALTTGKKLIVKNSLEDVVRKTIKYKQLCHQYVQVMQKTDSDLPKERG
ncbi:MAG: flagellar FlbD family protein [Chitinispirillaceae bacterium]|nr:flagellar FlbD family protein [Chitinispirillaceae bacterium]